jgi:hypothetical protein
VIREALSAKQRLTKKERERRVDAALQPESPPHEPLAPRPASAEPSARPDDTFYRLIRSLNQGDTGQSKPVQAASPEPAVSGASEGPPIREEATIRDLVSGQPASKPAKAPPETMPETSQPPVGEASPEAASDLAVIALGAAADDTVPMEQLSVEAVIARADQESGSARPLPRWMSQAAEDADQPTLVEPPVAVGDTHPSTKTPVEKVVLPGEADVPQGQAAADLSEQPTPPLSGLPAMLEEPSFVAQVIDDSPPTAFPPSPAPGPAPAVKPELPPAAAEPVARLAVQLTQLNVDSTAQATLLTRSGALLASAGQMPEQAINSIVGSINLVWQGAGAEGNALVRYINVTSLGDFLLYSIRTVEDMTLSMLFPAETPLRIIRHQARRLLNALEAVPEPPPVEAGAVPTLPSRPTDLRAPEGMRESMAAEVEAASQAAAEAEAAAPRVEGPYTAYAFVWLPRAGSLTPEVAGVLLEWINAIAAKHHWQVEGVEIQPTYTTIQVSIPANETPTTTVEALMRETAANASNPELWADAYYIVAPGRAVTQQEIASFMEYRRDAQDAA